MNAPIRRLYGLIVLLFLVLVVFTSRWTVFEAKTLRNNPHNRRALLEEARIKRGTIRAADGTVLARSIPAPGHTFSRTYPSASLFGHAVGYSFTTLGRSGLEKSRNEILTGQQRAGVSSIFDQLRGRRRQGDDITTTLDPTAQRIALRELGGRRGAVVALEPATGRIRVMASVPEYDPNAVEKRFSTLSQRKGSPLLNRVTQAGYPPGSTFKVVTAAAALDSGKFTPSSTVNGKSGIRISGVPLANDNKQNFGDIDLTKALTQSVNTVWAQVAEQLGRSTMAKYMVRFGFYRKPPLDYPADQLRASGEYRNGVLLRPRSGAIDVGRMGIGQDKLNVTPLQMAEVAATVANDGVRMQPWLTRRAVDRDGRRVLDVKPQKAARVMSKQAARALGQMMTQVVKEGTGTASALQGIDVAGKTGTAQITPNANVTQPWFIAFAPATKPQIAIAVTVERSNGGFGGTEAAPIAKTVMESLLGKGG
ncbi:MAG TPA: penicillin-binding transpeptidase domain-containing protein [Solirubrobacteraceae bacterium]|nr:penicillin-binding transpeptidase domain-containing protein [Solirubrobacteraceae bacterium]